MSVHRKQTNPRSLNKGRQLLVDFENGKINPHHALTASALIRSYAKDANAPLSALDFYGNSSSANMEQRIKRTEAIMCPRASSRLITSVVGIVLSDGVRNEISVRQYASHFGKPINEPVSLNPTTGPSQIVDVPPLKAKHTSPKVILSPKMVGA